MEAKVPELQNIELIVILIWPTIVCMWLIFTLELKSKKKKTCWQYECSSYFKYTLHAIALWEAAVGAPHTHREAWKKKVEAHEDHFMSAACVWSLPPSASNPTPLSSNTHTHITHSVSRWQRTSPEVTSGANVPLMCSDKSATRKC